MKTVRITVGDHVLESYAHGWKLGKPRPVEVKGKRTFALDDVRYYGSLASALKRAFRLVRTGQITFDKGDDTLTELGQLRELIQEGEARLLAVASALDTKLSRRSG